jgi:DNA-binding winged helix-turn-helix (wHTH) protein
MTADQNFSKIGLDRPRDGLDLLGEDNVTDQARPRSLAYRFDDLMLDVGQRRLRRGGQDVPLSKLCFAVLLALVKSAPNLLTHDEIVRRVWGPRRIVTPENLSQRVKLLRDSLGDDAAQPRYIECVRGEGYRLVPAVAVVSNAAESSANDVLAVPSTPERESALPRASPKRVPRRLAGALGAWALTAVAVLIALAMGLFSGRPSKQDPPVAGTQRLVTDFPGNHTHPTFSPDGAMIAFASDASGEWQIWVQSLRGSSAAVQLTDEKIAAREPSWSPLNDQIDRSAWRDATTKNYR